VSIRHFNLHEDGGGDASRPAARLTGLLGGLLQYVLQSRDVLRMLYRHLEITLTLAESDGRGAKVKVGGEGEALVRGVGRR